MAEGRGDEVAIVTVEQALSVQCPYCFALAGAMCAVPVGTGGGLAAIHTVRIQSFKSKRKAP